MIKVKRALISVSDKKGIISFVKGLAQRGIEILSTGGTAKSLREAGLSVVDVSEYTGFPEMLDGRVKTLHPKIHGGILALREKKEHMEQLEKHEMGLIDMVVVNLYPFESVIKKKNVDLEEAIENIDIGGPTMLRSAAKNFRNVAVICNPDRYQDILNELEVNSGLLSDSVLFQLAVDVFRLTAKYDGAISEFLNKFLSGQDFTQMPKELMLKFHKIQDLRYGENPHQQAAFYSDSEEKEGLADLKQLHGKELSFNNILDLNAAVDFIKDFNAPAAVVIKHNNPSGLAENDVLAQAYLRAWSCDPLSAFGGIIGLNRIVDAKTAKYILESGFMECVVAPGFDREALKALKIKKNLRLVKIKLKSFKNKSYDFRKVAGGLLLQEKDGRDIRSAEIRIVTKKKPTASQLDSALFGWKAIKSVKSNAIILVKGRQTVGLGCGQTSRVESVKIAIDKAGKKTKGSVLVSDAFIPKTDNVTLAAKAGIKVIIQTGGSIADEAVIQEADKCGIAMIFTGIRHFKH